MEVGGTKKETFKKERDDFFLGGCVLLEGRRKIQLGRGTLQIFKKWREEERRKNGELLRREKREPNGGEEKI